MNTINVSQSRIKTWRRCQRAHYNKYVLKLKRKRVSRPLSFGRLVHQMIEEHANGRDPFDVPNNISMKDLSMFAAEREHYGEIVEDVNIIMEAYFDYWEASRTALQYVEVNGKRAEHRFEITMLGGEVKWVGLIDAIGRERGHRWLVEHKSFSRMPGDDDRWRSLQSAVYIRANDILGWKPLTGTLWDYIWSKSPPRPGLLKNGQLSKKNTPTLYGAIKVAAKDAGLTRKAARELGALTHKPELWFSRTRNPIKPKLIDMLFADFETSVREIVEGGEKCRTMNVERHCSWCDFEPMCRAEMTGGDVDYVKGREYTVDKKDDETERDPPIEGQL